MYTVNSIRPHRTVDGEGKASEIANGQRSHGSVTWTRKYPDLGFLLLPLPLYRPPKLCCQGEEFFLVTLLFLGRFLTDLMASVVGLSMKRGKSKADASNKADNR
ncbi:hypothetical protein GW17_00046714 [Ensete ventricosum]|nr:hypothetical protein GW17_00046714 [Ensete ventricosum]